MNSCDALLPEALAASEAKMHQSGATPNCIAAFLKALSRLSDSGSGLVPESTIQPVTTLPQWSDLPAPGHPQWLEHLVVIKLNGGLGTKMGLDFAKSLIHVKGQETFLDFIARQILYLRQAHDVARPAFLLMNSFRTQQDTLDHLVRYPKLSNPGLPLDLLQSKVPKIDAQTFLPAAYPADRELEWCPPGHGDLYPSLADSGLLDQLLAQGIEFAFVSNSDNLAATVDLPLLHYFAESGLAFLMEVAERTEADRKGGHLARRASDGRLVLREVAQCPESDRVHFEGPRHRFFNTNNLWIRLPELRRILPHLALPIIKNLKPVNPQDPASPRVLQLETAMGAAIECFDPAGAILVPRHRFSPVKDTSDLLALRSDAYEITEDFRLTLVARRAGRPPSIKLDTTRLCQLSDFEKCFAAGPPSLVDCDELTVEGPWQFNPGVVCRGRVQFINRTADLQTITAGPYQNQTLIHPRLK